jgi:hypothetical protein
MGLGWRIRIADHRWLARTKRDLKLNGMRNENDGKRRITNKHKLTNKTPNNNSSKKKNSTSPSPIPDRTACAANGTCLGVMCVR